MIDGPWNMTTHHAGGLLLAELGAGEVSLLRDVNGDGDALASGEVTRWSAGLHGPVAIVRIPEPSGLPLMIGSAAPAILASKRLRQRWPTFKALPSSDSIESTPV